MGVSLLSLSSRPVPTEVRLREDLRVCQPARASHWHAAASALRLARAGHCNFKETVMEGRAGMHSVITGKV